MLVVVTSRGLGLEQSALRGRNQECATCRKAQARGVMAYASLQVIARVC